jgi:hypothetical protein
VYKQILSYLFDIENEFSFNCYTVQYQTLDWSNKIFQKKSGEIWQQRYNIKRKISRYEISIIPPSKKQAEVYSTNLI